MAYRKSIIQLTTRLRAPLHGKLVSAAKAHDISLNEEMERRLEQSFDDEKWPTRSMTISALFQFMARHREHADAILREMTERAEETEIWRDAVERYDPQQPQGREPKPKKRS